MDGHDLAATIDITEQDAAVKLVATSTSTCPCFTRSPVAWWLLFQPESISIRDGSEIDVSIFASPDGIPLTPMDVTEEAVRDICTDAVFERGENYLSESRIREIHRVDATVTAVVSGSRQYDVRVDLTADQFEPRCNCAYDGTGACKHVVAVLLRCVDKLPPDEGDRLNAALEAADADDLQAFLRETLAGDAALRERFFARFGEGSTRSIDELRAAIDRQFEETNSDYYVVFEPVDFSEWFDLAAMYREQERYAPAAAVYRALLEALNDNMERVDGAYDHFSQAFSQALDGYVDCVGATDCEGDAAADAVAFLDERASSGTSFLAEHFERAAAELQEGVGERSPE